MEDVYELPHTPEKTIREKILGILENFPKVTPSMLQITIGSGVPTSLWHPILEELIAEETLYRYTKQVKSPSGRYSTQTVISTEPDPSIANTAPTI